MKSISTSVVVGRVRRSEDKKREVVKRFLASGKSMYAFCRDNPGVISYASLIKYCKAYAKSEGEADHGPEGRSCLSTPENQRIVKSSTAVGSLMRRQSDNFIELQVNTKPNDFTARDGTRSKRCVELSLPSGARLLIPPDCDQDQILTLLETIREAGYV